MIGLVMEYTFGKQLTKGKLFRGRAKRRSKINDPAVIGAIIVLGYCLNFVDSGFLPLLRVGYNLVKAECFNANIDMPKNTYRTNSGDLLLRNLDCAVIERIHRWNTDNDYLNFDSVCGVFWEGDDLYPNSGFKEKNHIQICIRNTNCIKGYFNPLEASTKYPIP